MASAAYSEKPGYEILYEKIRDALMSNSGMAAGKMGSAELNAAYFLSTGQPISDFPEMYMRHITVNAGLYPPSISVVRQWHREFLRGIESLDCIAPWFSPQKEDFMIKKFCSARVKKIELTDLEPYYWRKEF
jgi:hypothetical protein